MKVTAHALEAKGDAPTLTGPIGIRIIFTLDRPKNHFGTGKNASLVKPSSPDFPATMPDIDKLMRAILDGLTDARVWDDDGQVVWVQATKVWSDERFSAGAYLTIGEML
jgi:Holliday junction resolvase RusA-like endonuclease